jgi:NADH-quinone oxidoreductase subunit G
VLNARIRKAWSAGAEVALIGEAADLTYGYAHLGTDRAALARALAEAEAGAGGIVIVGQAALRGSDGESVLAHVLAIAERTGAGLLVLHAAASRVGAMDVGAVTEGGLGAALEGADVVWNLGADEIEIAAGPVVIYQGHHGDRGAHRADIILPGAAYTEEAGLFVNTEGRPQLALRAGFPPGEAKENWAILRAVSAEVGRPQPWNALAELRRALLRAVPHLEMIDAVPENEGAALPLGPLAAGPFVTGGGDHYLVNPIARASALMAELSRNAAARRSARLAAE